MTALKGEYWWTADDELLCATDGGDYNHEGLVMRELIAVCCEALGIQNEFDTDACWFRTHVFDNSPPEDEEPLEAAWSVLREDRSVEEVEKISRLIGGKQDDARVFAIKYWKWIRISQHHIEVPDFTAGALQRAHAAISEAYWEEHEEELPDDFELFVNRPAGRSVQTTAGRLRIGDIEKSDGEIEALVDRLNRAAKASVRKMSVGLVPAFTTGKKETKSPI